MCSSLWKRVTYCTVQQTPANTNHGVLTRSTGPTGRFQRCHRGPPSVGHARTARRGRSWLMRITSAAPRFGASSTPSASTTRTSRRRRQGSAARSQGRVGEVKRHEQTLSMGVLGCGLWYRAIVRKPSRKSFAQLGSYKIYYCKKGSCLGGSS